MKRILWLSGCLFLFCTFLQAQNGRIPAYYFTQASERYFSDEEYDELLKESAEQVFSNWKMAPATFTSRYPKLKTRLLSVARTGIGENFRWVESNAGRGIQAEKGTEEFSRYRQQYIGEFRKAIAAAFAGNSELRSGLSYPNSDRIYHYQSLVQVLPDGKLRVTENIRVYNGDGGGPNDGSGAEAYGGNNNEIKRGIYRSFPTSYFNQYHLNQNTSFELVSVEVNGRPDKYELQKKANGFELRIYDPARTLNRGNYVFTVVYETRNQIKHLSGYDELYWNVTGNGWNFRIDSAECRIEMPAALLSGKCYTGVQDSKAEDCQMYYRPEKDSLLVVFKTAHPLKPNEGLTVSVSCRKGLVADGLSGWAGAWYMFKSNLPVFLMPLLALLMLAYNFLAWWKVGRDPEAGNIYPQFYPPAGYSPAAMGYIREQGFNHKLTAATLVDLAVRHYLKIDVEKEGLIFKDNVYHIRPAQKQPVAAAYEDFHEDAEDLIGGSIKKGKYNEDLKDLNDAVKTYCEGHYKKGKAKGFFALNNMYMAPGNLLTTVGFFSVAIFVLPRQFNIWQLGYLTGGLILCIFIQTIFYRLIRVYTKEGREILDTIEGFRMYLKAADEHRINAMNPPEKTPELYEKYMPYAIALDCEIEWSRQFEGILGTAALEPGQSSGIHSRSFSDSHFSSSFAEGFSGSISSSGTPPSSSSGGGSSFGGGSSGGGGGGGGGGGL